MVEQATATSTIFSDSFHPVINNVSELSSPIGAREDMSPLVNGEKAFNQIEHHREEGQSRNLLINHFFGQTLHKQSPFHVKAKRVISRSPIGNYTQEIKVPDTQSQTYNAQLSPFLETALTPDGNRHNKILLSKNRTRNQFQQSNNKTALNMDIKDLTLPEEHMFSNRKRSTMIKATYRINQAKVTYGIMLKNRAEYNSFLQQKDTKRRRPRQVLHFGGGPNRVPQPCVEQLRETNYIPNNTFESIKARDLVQTFQCQNARSTSPQVRAATSQEPQSQKRITPVYRQLARGGGGFSLHHHKKLEQIKREKAMQAQQCQPVSHSAINRSTISVTKAVSQLDMCQPESSLSIEAPTELPQKTIITPTRSKINLQEAVMPPSSVQKYPKNKSQRQLSISEQSMYNQSDNSIMTNPLQSINPQELDKQLCNPYINGGVEINYSSTRPATAYVEKQQFSQTQNLIKGTKGIIHLRSNRPVKQMAEVPLLVIQPHNDNPNAERPASSFHIKGYSRPSTAISRNSHLQRTQTNYTQCDVAQKVLLSRSFRALSKGNQSTLLNSRKNFATPQQIGPQFFTRQLKLNEQANHSPKKQQTQALRANVIQLANLQFNSVVAPLKNLKFNQHFDREHRLAVVIPLVIGGGLAKNAVQNEDVHTILKVSKRENTVSPAGHYKENSLLIKV